MNDIQPQDDAPGCAPRDGASRFHCFCGAERSRVVLSGPDFRILRCAVCGACRTDPPPLEPPPGMPELVEGHRHHGELFRRLLGDVLAEVLRHHTGGRFLDVGCSVGHLLDLASEQGFDVTGIELDPLALRYARERFGDRVLGMALEEAPLAAESFDVVTINDVLEHVPRPVDLLRGVRTLLRPDGIVVVGAPNFASWASRMEGLDWYGLQPAGHVWQFSPGSVVDCLRRAGLRALRVRTNQLYRTWKPGWRHRARKLLYDTSERIGRGDGLLVTAVRDGRAS